MMGGRLGPPDHKAVFDGDKELFLLKIEMAKLKGRVDGIQAVFLLLSIAAGAAIGLLWSPP